MDEAVLKARVSLGHNFRLEHLINTQALDCSVNARDLEGVVELLKREVRIENPVERLWTQEAVKYLERVVAQKRVKDVDDPDFLKGCSVSDSAWSGFKDAGVILARQRLVYNDMGRYESKLSDAKRAFVDATNAAKQ